MDWVIATFVDPTALDRHGPGQVVGANHGRAEPRPAGNRVRIALPPPVVLYNPAFPEADGIAILDSTWH